VFLASKKPPEGFAERNLRSTEHSHRSLTFGIGKLEKNSAGIDSALWRRKKKEKADPLAINSRWNVSKKAGRSLDEAQITLSGHRTTVDAAACVSQSVLPVGIRGGRFSISRSCRTLHNRGILSLSR